jgi:predicted RNA binding protein YcfA (HicA-like mRNA interferase family)
MKHKNKDVNRLLKALVRDGWALTQNSHWKVTSPQGRVVTFSGSASDCYLFNNLKKDLRRYAGIDPDKLLER